MINVKSEIICRRKYRLWIHIAMSQGSTVDYIEEYLGDMVYAPSTAVLVSLSVPSLS